MVEANSNTNVCDIFVIGGGINGCGIARDAAGRGLSVVLAEKGDLASATSSASTKLFHGGLRYLEYFEVRLVREALKEREILLHAMPHISWPMRFVLPYHKDMRFEGETPTSRILKYVMPWTKGSRPAWLIRVGLFLYDNLGGRRILPGTSTIDLTKDEAGVALQDRFQKAFEYSDCWVEDSRLVVLNARDAENLGARIMTRSKVISAERDKGGWHVSVENQTTGEVAVFRSRLLVNAGGPWVEDILRNTVNINSAESVRLVKGSHIVTKKLFDHDKCYFFQGEDGRIVFAIPYETDFTLIGTTDENHKTADITPVCSESEAKYLREFASRYFKKRIQEDDVIWNYSGVRPLFNDGASTATAATRDYVLSLDSDDGAPLLNVFGGKITTYRKLAEAALKKIGPFFDLDRGKWTAGVPLPGGDFPVGEVEKRIEELRDSYPFLGEIWARRLIKAYGTDSYLMLGDVTSLKEMGRVFGTNLTEKEVVWLMEKEFARTAHDVVWRRSKLGLRLTKDEIANLDEWMKDELNIDAPAKSA